MSNPKKRVYRTSAEIRQQHTIRNSLQELLSLQQRARAVEMHAIEQIRALLDTSRKYVGQVDGRYVSSLLQGAATAAGELGKRLDKYANVIHSMQQGVGDFSGVGLTLLADFSDEQLIIDTNIYKPLHDVQCEINKYASEDDRVDLNELEDFIASFDNTFTVGEKA